MSKKISKPKTKVKPKAKAKNPSKLKAKSKAKPKSEAKNQSKTKVKAKTALEKNLKTKPSFNSSRIIITRSPEICVLEGFTTPDGHKVEHPSIELIDSIALEYYNKGTLNPGDFGPFSIYCTFADFIQTKNYWTTDLIKSLVTSDHILGNGCGTHCVVDSRKEELRPKLRSFLSELGFTLTDDQQAYQSQQFVEALQDFISTQSPERQTAFALLNGMLNFDLSLLLLFLSGKLNFNDFSEIARSPYEGDDPDQWTEQQWINDIREFLVLTGEEPPLTVHDRQAA